MASRQMSAIDFLSKQNELRLNPKLSLLQKEFYLKAWEIVSKELSSHIGIATSGTSSEFGKLVLLNKQAFLKSAESVNQHLNVMTDDIWLKALPDFHVGGLSILARASLSNSKVIELDLTKWDAKVFFESLIQTRASLISLVPTQIFDIVQMQLKAPPSVRAIIVGGAALAPDLYQKASQLGWRLLTSYGMTETCSMIACSELSDALGEMPLPKILNHVHVRVQDELLEISSSSLLTGYIIKTEKGIERIDPKFQDQNTLWFRAEDRARLLKNRIEILGRGSDFYKIGGESTSILRLENILAQVRLQYLGVEFDLALVAVPNERLGHQIELLSTAKSENQIAELVSQFNQKVAAFEKIRCSHLTEQIPRTALGKLKKQEALALILGRS
jgi:O-succinylbenzoic acid--CoA ligase